MALTTNQVSDVVQGAVGRPATDFEVSQFSKAPIQDLASLKGYYGGLNKDTSIVDYLKYNGKDSSLSARNSLAQEYKIQNYDPGSADSNKALMAALRAGTPPKNTSTVDGSVSGASAAPTSSQAPQATPTQPTQQQDGTPQPDQTPTSSQDTTNPPKIDGIDDALTQYKNSQQAVVDIDSAISSTLDNKRKEIIASGGVVDESQLKSIVYAENAPLLDQRKTLVAEQANAGKNYQNLLNTQKQSDANFYKTQDTALKNRAQTEKESTDASKIEQGQQKIDQGQQKINISNVKVEKTSAYDEYGNKTGDVLQKITLLPDGTSQTTQMPLDKNGALTKQGVAMASSGSVTDPGTKSAAVITSTSTPAYASSFSGNADAPTDENQAVSIPGTTLTIGSLYQSALDWMSKPQTSTSARSGKTVVINTQKAIAAKGSAILQSLGIPKTAYEAAYKANSAALSKQMGSYAALSVNEKAATLNFQTLLTLSKKADSATYQAASPVLEGWIRTGSVASTGNPDVNNFVAQLVLTMNEYAKVIAGQTTGGSVSDSARQETEKLLSSGMSYDSVKSFYDNVASKDIDNRVTAARGSIQELMGGLGAGTVPGSKDSSSSSTLGSKGDLSDRDFVAQTLQSHNLNYDAVLKQYTPMLQKGEQLALSNSDGSIVAATPAEIKSGAYTPL